MLNFNKRDNNNSNSDFLIVTHSVIDLSLQQKIDTKFINDGYGTKFITVDSNTAIENIATNNVTGFIIYLNSKNKESVILSLTSIRKKIPYNIPLVIFDSIDSYSLIGEVKNFNAIYHYCDFEVELPSYILKLDVELLISEFDLINSSLSNTYAERVLIIPMEGGLGSSFLAKKIIEKCSDLKMKSLLRTLSSNRDSDILFTSKIKKQAVIIPSELTTHNERYRAMKDAVFNIDQYSDSYHTIRFKSEDEIEMVKVLDNNYNFILDICDLFHTEDININYYDKIIFILSKKLSSVRNLSQFISKHQLTEQEVMLMYSQKNKTANFTDAEMEGVIGSNADIKCIQSFNKKIDSTDFTSILNCIFNINAPQKSLLSKFWE